MEYGSIKYVGKPVSRIVMGTMILNIEKRDWSFSLLDDMFALGVNTYDTAAVYPHDGEAVLMEWIHKRGIRDKIVLLTKGAHHNKWRKRVTSFDILSDVQNSLAKPGGDYIDIFMLHRDDSSIPVSIIIETLNRLHDAGKICSFGGSNWSRERIQEANDYAIKYGMMPFSSISPNYSLAEQVQNPWGDGCVTLTGTGAVSDRSYYQAQNMPVFSYSSLGRGFMSGRFHSSEYDNASRILDEASQRGYMYACNFERLARTEQLAAEMKISVPQLALGWLFNQPLNIFSIIGVENRKQMQENIQALSIKLTTSQLSWLDLQIDSL